MSGGENTGAISWADLEEFPTADQGGPESATDDAKRSTERAVDWFNDGDDDGDDWARVPGGASQAPSAAAREQPDHSSERKEKETPSGELDIEKHSLFATLACSAWRAARSAPMASSLTLASITTQWDTPPLLLSR